MLTLPPTVKIYVARQPVNMRKSFNGLTGVVRAQLELDPTSGHLFCFFNRRRTLMKILFCDDTGYSSERSPHLFTKQSLFSGGLFSR
jgi:transposase